MTLELYIAFVAAASVLIAVPGPTNMVVTSSALRVGFKRSLWTVAGAALSHAVLIALAGIGLTTLLSLSAEAFGVLRWIGAGYLVWLGVRQWRDAGRAGEFPEVRGGRRLFLDGFLTNSSNPKALVFYAGFLPPFLAPELPVALQVALLGATFVAIFVVVAIAHALLAARLGRATRGGVFAKAMLRLSGAFLVTAGLLLATSSRR